MKIIFTAFLFCMLINANGQITDETGWKIYLDKEFSFTLKYPPDWRADTMPAAGNVILYAPENKSDTFTASVAVDAFELPAGAGAADVKNFAEVSYVQFKKTITDCRLMVNKDISAGGIAKYLVVCNGMLNKKYVYFKQVYCIHNNIAYIINYTGIAGKKDYYAITAGDILNSFSPQKVINE